MRTVDYYADAARDALQITSDRELSRRLNVSPATVNQWRTRRTWPADETMIRLADLAGIDPTEALMDLNRWRATSPTVRSVYDRIAHRLAATAAGLTLVTLATLGSHTAEAGEAAVCPTGERLCILWKMKWDRLRRFLKRIGAAPLQRAMLAAFALVSPRVAASAFNSPLAT